MGHRPPTGLAPDRRWIASQLLLLLHLVGFAALLAGYLVQLRALEPEINAAMLYGSWTGFASGSAMVVLVASDRV
jgi:hypothetical protein